MIYDFGSFAVDTERLELKSSGETVSVQPQVFALIVYLIENRDRVVSKDDIIDNVWDGRIVSDGTLNARINAARRALDDNGEDQAVIKTFARRGFRLVANVRGEERLEDRKPKTANHADKPSLAVLPFVNMGGNPDEEFLADGITEDLVTALAKLRGFFVTDRSTTFAYKNTSQDARSIASEVGVRYVLQGSVRSVGSRIRISVQLTESESSSQIWSERYDRDLTDIFAIQDEITENLVGCLAPELFAAEHARLRRRTPGSLDAWECFVRALHLYGQQSQSSSSHALELLEQAIELDPDYSQALGLYATTLTWRAIQRWEPFEQSIEKAKGAADRAILADSNDPWASIGRGYVSTAARESNMAIMNYGRAVDLSPNFAYAHGLLGAANAYAGNSDLAITHIDKAISLSPRDTFIDKYHLYHAIAYFQAGRYPEAVEATNRAIQLKPEHASSHMFRTAALALEQDHTLAKSALQGFTELVPDANTSTIESAIAYVNPDDRKRLADGLRMAGLD